MSKLIFETMPSEIGCPVTLTSGAFLNQKCNKQTSHELQKNLDSSCISFCTSSRKRQLKKTLSVSAISKQVSRCCINFPHELTCQILTNRSIEIGLGAWPSRDYGEKSQACKSRLNFCVRDQFEIKIFKVRLMNTTYFICIEKKIELEPAIIWKVATCQRITS